MLRWLLGLEPVRIEDLGTVAVTRQALRASADYLGAPWEAVRRVPVEELAARAAETAAIIADRERRASEMGRSRPPAGNVCTFRKRDRKRA